MAKAEKRHLFLFPVNIYCISEFLVVEYSLEGKLKTACRVLCAAAALLVAFPAAFAQPTGADGDRAAIVAGSGTAAAAAEEDLVLTESSGNEAGKAGTLSGSAWPYFLRMLLTLGLVLGAIWVVFRLLRRAARPKAQPDAFIRVLASAPLGAGKWLYVVSLGAKAFLVGATDSSVQLIHEIEDGELIDEMKLRSATAPQDASRDFGTLLLGLLKPGSKHRAEPAKGISGTDFLARQRDRLKKF